MPSVIEEKKKEKKKHILVINIPRKRRKKKREAPALASVIRDSAVPHLIHLLTSRIAGTNPSKKECKSRVARCKSDLYQSLMCTKSLSKTDLSGDLRSIPSYHHHQYVHVRTSAHYGGIRTLKQKSWIYS